MNPILKPYDATGIMSMWSLSIPNGKLMLLLQCHPWHISLLPNTVSLVSPGAERLCKLKPFGLINPVLPHESFRRILCWSSCAVFKTKHFQAFFSLGVSFLREPGLADFHYPSLYFHLWWSAGPWAKFSIDIKWIHWLPQAYRFIWKKYPLWEISLETLVHGLGLWDSLISV